MIDYEAIFFALQYMVMGSLNVPDEMILYFRLAILYMFCNFAIGLIKAIGGIIKWK